MQGGLSLCIVLHQEDCTPVKDFGKGDPVNTGKCAKAGIDIARERKHRLVDGCEQSPKDDHACWGKKICQCAAEGLGRIRQKLSQSLKIANLQEWCSLSAKQILQTML